MQMQIKALNSKNVLILKHVLLNIKYRTSPVYPTAYNSHTTSNGNTPHHHPQQQQQPQLFKTTIPINEQDEHQPKSSCHCETADLAYTQMREQQTAALRNNISYGQSKNNDVINTIKSQQQQQQAQPLCFCGSPNNALRSSQANKNHTTTNATTTTTIEYELSNGIAKLTKISTSRNGNVEQPTIDSTAEPLSSTTSITPISSNINDTNYINNLPPLLTSKDLANLQENLEAINAFNIKQNSTILQQQQRANYSTMSNANCKRDRIGVPCSGNVQSLGLISGYERLKNARYSKGKAFTIAERQLLGIHGLLPSCVRTVEEQVCQCLAQIEYHTNDFTKYLYLQNLSQRNERLFYHLLSTNVSKMMPLVYTPTVGEACQKFSMFFHGIKGLFITIRDKGHIYEVLQNWPERDIRAICVTDGERILGLGDLGANGMGIPIGKLSLYTALARIPPNQCLPITLDVGTNTKSILEDPFYIGIREKRVTGKMYDEFLDEFMQAVVRRYGQHCLIQFEDFGNANAFRLLAKYRNDYCTFNDDIQGTASVALAGILASLKITKTKLQDNKIVFFGAGEAALGIANLCSIALQNEGLSAEDARKLIFMVDSRGLIVCNRPTGGLTEHKLQFAQNMEPINTLEEVINTVKPSILIGAAAIGGAFTKEILNAMVEYNETPIIFALSNPTSKAECTADQAYSYTKGKCIFASGSPFGPVEYGNKKYYPGQGNNSYIFPGVALGVICSGMEIIPEEVFLVAAERLAELVSADDLAKGSLYPPLKDITCVSLQIAKKIMIYAYEKGLASVRPEPKDKLEFIKSQLYDIHYPQIFPQVYGEN